MPDDWTRAMVADRMDLAADVMRSLPPVRPQGYVSIWPDYLHSFADQVGQEPRMRRPLPSPRMITQRAVNPFRSRETFFGETPQGVTDPDREAIRTIR